MRPEMKDVPFSYPVKVGHVSANPVTVTIAADADERAALAQSWNVLEVGELAAEMQVSRWKRDGVRVKGRCHARLTQACVVTLEPVEAVIDEPFEALFVPEGSRLARPDLDGGEVVVDPDGPDMPEPFSGDTIDVGAVVAEFAALAIDPYPRKPGAEFAPAAEGAEGEEEGASPFARLKDWRRGDD
ncbi:MAG: DUF177 domain-containing protein [Pararhizobium sp.]